MINIKNENFRSMFREYDIRGRVNDEELNSESVYHIASAYAEFVKRRRYDKAVVGYDSRACSIGFANAVSRALCERGINVISIGLSTSPLVYFAQYHFGCEAAVMVTASHNPDGWSGFKLANGFSKTLEPEDIKELFELVIDLPSIGGNVKCGMRTDADIRSEYLNSIVSRIEMGENRPRVVIDAGNGGAGLFAYELFQRLGCMTFQLHCDPDVTFPNYFPNPSDIKARDKLREMVLHPYIKADIGIGFDGDGDRMGVIDENGDDVWSDTILSLLAKPLLEKKHGETVVYDVKCSRVLEQTIEKYGGVPLMWKTGHSYIKAKMQETGATLAGERSGHIFFGGDEYFGFDDALFAGAKLVEFISHQAGTISAVLGGLPQYVTSPEIQAFCDDTKKYGVIEEVVIEFNKKYPGRVNDICGARVSFDHGFGLVRASSNLPELVLIFEGDTEKDMLEIKDIFHEILDRYPDINKEWSNEID